MVPSPHLPFCEPKVDPTQFGSPGAGAESLVECAAVVCGGVVALPERGVQFADSEGNVAAFSRFGREQGALVTLDRVRDSAKYELRYK